MIELFFLVNLFLSGLNLEIDESVVAQEIDGFVEDTVERVQDQSFNDWVIKLLIAGEAVVIYWLYKIVKDQKTQKEFVEGVRGFFQKEKSEELTHRRFAKLLYAIGWDVLYISQGNFNSVRKLLKGGRVLLFFKEEKDQETIYFVKELKDNKVFCEVLDGLDENQETSVVFELSDFFKKQTFSFIVFLGTRCESCFRFKETILGQNENWDFGAKENLEED